jgi:hypothetical protein
MSHRKPQAGEVVQFALPDGRFAYGRVLNGGSVAFYRDTTEAPGNPPIGSRDFQFIVGVDRGTITSDDVPIVGQDPAKSKHDDWAPNGSIQDPITGKRSLYDSRTGKITPSTPNQTQDLEPVASWAHHHIIDRLMGFGHLWTKSAYDVAQEAIRRRERGDRS